MWSLLSEFDSLDLAIFTALLSAGIFFLYRHFLSEFKSTFVPVIVPGNELAVCKTSADDSSFVSRMLLGARNIAIFYGSQTGTAEELAGRLAKDAQRYGLKTLVLDPEQIDIEEFPRISEVKNSLVILCMATYGEGDPTDNAQTFFELLQATDCEMTGISYAVFGLGNKTYEHYNEMGKYIDKRLEELGGKRVFELGLGDDDSNLEEDFMRWREAFWPAVAQKFGWQESEMDIADHRQYRLELLDENTNPNVVFRGELNRLGSFERQRPPYDQKNPYLAPIVFNFELHTQKSPRSCKHIEFDIDGSKIRYEAGDHAAVFPTNDKELVDEMGKLLDADLDVLFRLVNTDDDNTKKHPFPCPTSYRIALTHYVDICAPVKSHVLKAIAEFAVDEQQKRRLLLLSTASDEGLKEYSVYIQKERRSILDVLRDFHSCRPPIDYLLELLPRLQVRYYSISSSPRSDPCRLAITAVVLQYQIADRTIRGVCTNYLASNTPSSSVPMFVRKSTIRLPPRTTTAVIMLGPGTGFAPFRGFIQDRAVQKQKGKEIGPMVLFYGCRRRDEDFIYGDELAQFVASGVLTELHLAFSRQSEEKVYVQHKLWDNRHTAWSLLENGAHIYVCGDAKNMARDVQNMFCKIAMELGRKTSDEATKWFRDLERQKRYQADVWS